MRRWNLGGLVFAVLLAAGCDTAGQLTAPEEAGPVMSTSTSVSISGPTDIYEAGIHEWVANASGGCDPSQRTYTWYGGANLQFVIAYGPTLRWGVDETWASRSMKVVVEEPGHASATAYVYVTNHMYDNGGGGGNDM